MADRNITMVRGDTLAFNLELVDFDQDLDSCYFTAKQNYTDEVNLFQKSLENGITKVDDGLYSIRVAPEDTATAQAGKYFYDLQIGVNEDIFTVIKGVLELEQDITY